MRNQFTFNHVNNVTSFEDMCQIFKRCNVAFLDENGQVFHQRLFSCYIELTFDKVQKISGYKIVQESGELLGLQIFNTFEFNPSQPLFLKLGELCVYNAYESYTINQLFIGCHKRKLKLISWLTEGF